MQKSRETRSLSYYKDAGISNSSSHTYTYYVVAWIARLGLHVSQSQQHCVFRAAEETFPTTPAALAEGSSFYYHSFARHTKAALQTKSISCGHICAGLLRLLLAWESQLVQDLSWILFCKLDSSL